MFPKMLWGSGIHAMVLKRRGLLSGSTVSGLGFWVLQQKSTMVESRVVVEEVPVRVLPGLL